MVKTGFTVHGGMRLAQNSEETPTTPGAWIYHHRKRAGLNQTQLGTFAGVTKQYISQLERETQSEITGELMRPSVEIIDRIAARLAPQTKFALGYQRELRRLYNYADEGLLIPGGSATVFTPDRAPYQLGEHLPPPYTADEQAERLDRIETQLAELLRLAREERAAYKPKGDTPG